MEAPCQDWSYAFLSALHAQWQMARSRQWCGVDSLATHEIRKALLQISRFIYQQFVSKCAAAQIKVPAACLSTCPSVHRFRPLLSNAIHLTHAQIAAGLASWRRSGRVPISMGSSASASEFHHRLAQIQKEATN